MVERRKSTTAGNKLRSAPSSTSSHATSTPEEAVPDVILSIFDHCGLFWDSGKDPSQLRPSLRILLSKIQHFDRSKDDLWMIDRSKENFAAALLSYNHDSDNDGDTILLELEQCLHQVRANASVFIQTTLRNERCGIIALRDEFLDQYDSYGADCFCSREWFILVQTIIAHFINQLQMEESVIHEKLYPLLDSIYETNFDVMKASLQEMIHCLSRASLREFIPYMQAVEQLEKHSTDRMTWQSARQLPRMTVPSFSKTTVVATDQSKVALPMEAFDRIKTNTYIPSTMLDEFLPFLNSSVNVDQSNCEGSAGNIRALLLLGSVGSGKSYICAELEQSARSLHDSSLFGMFDTAYVLL
jgi:hypothetical protein